ncbi:Na+/H+ antiporter NhaC family protein [Natranaerobius thermophilus]|uniref:Na+/H+ antiporter NhaC n=1 Tax=Natranaerobius thermophilus (strain ATCC BAA-1301 / DSM 18059 / JW/NM-WN-LF) TaxID=457570 RepID=B2A840_NATTJ|nr:Na+/H+ antiporter NhaC family protein [Natranaerobius thermophilus]ACB85808.1 Na+/H+ antiporter NhaC [Natranaerobius thermophilus JW/NM-WN-LF]
MKNEIDKAQEIQEGPKANPIALLPFILFLGLYLGIGIYLQVTGVEDPFYQFPMPVAVSIGVVLAFIILKGTVAEKTETFLAGMGEKNILTMCTIYLLAGAFSAVSEAMGGVDSVVNFGLSLAPVNLLTIGLFLITGFISISTGTSMGALGAVAPIALGFAQETGLSLPLIMAVIIGGAMFGDNLSVISDTTIAATTSQGVKMRDKFKINLFIAVPAALVTIVLLFFFSGTPDELQTGGYDYNLIKIIPYIFVLIFAIAGGNVFLVLTSGIVMAGLIGMLYGELNFLTFGQEIYDGFLSMMNVFLVSLITGGLAKMVTDAGGLQYLVDSINKRITSKNSAELGIAGLVALTDAAIANNTIAIIINGPIAKKISRTFKVDPRRSAALMDIAACVMQGALPYGAQILMVMGLTGGAVGPLDVIPLLWYQGLLAIFGIMSIFIPFANKLIKDEPWDWEQEESIEG